MKKLIIAIAVFGVFILYSLGIRDKSPVLSKPLSLATNNSPNNSGATGAGAPPTNTTPSSNGTPATTSSGTNPSGQYKDGTYEGSVADAYYGNVQVSATISGGKITDVKFLQYPDTHSTSVIINQQAMPYLKQEAIQSQNFNVQVISGATFTSRAFMQSLAAALSQA
jgi:uncharacterized protein with FMN-binding domain